MLVLSYETYQLILWEDLERAEDLQVPHLLAHTFAKTVGILAGKNIRCGLPPCLLLRSGPV
jgi:hypothetical protein